MKYYDVIIAGASFGGLKCARVLAENGLSVCVLELKKDITKGIHTTGIIVKEAADLFDLPDHLVKEIKNVRLYAPSHKYIDLSASDYFFLATDTPNLMAYLKDKAIEAGAEILMNTPYRKAEQRGDRITVNDTFECEFLIGADGPDSVVAKDWNLGKNTKFLLGVEAEFSKADLPHDDGFYCFLDQKTAYGYLGWVVPGVDAVQVGLATTLPVKPDIDAFIKQIAPLFNLDESKIIARRGGRIPVGDLVHPLGSGNVILLGDAAGMVSPFSAGGIHTAYYYGGKLARDIVDYKKNGGMHPLEKTVHDYPKFRMKKFKRFVFENFAPNWALNLLIGNPLFEVLAKIVFFKEKRLK